MVTFDDLTSKELTKPTLVEDFWERGEALKALSTYAKLVVSHRLQKRYGVEVKRIPHRERSAHGKAWGIFISSY